MGLKDIQPKANGQDLIIFNTDDPANFRISRILSSANNIATTPYVEEVRTMAFGLKLKYAFLF